MVVLLPHTAPDGTTVLVNQVEGRRTPEQLAEQAEALGVEIYPGFAGAEVLYDDRKGVSAGEKFKDSDLLGIPVRIVISKKMIMQEKLELKGRTDVESRLISKEELFALLK